MALAEIDRLNTKVLELTQQLAAAKGEDGSDQLLLELALVQEQLKNFQNKVFGESTERRPKEKPPKKPKKKRGHGPRPQPALAQEDVVLELPETERACPKCGDTLKEVPGMTEDSELISVLRRKYLLLKAMRQKYRCKCNGALVTAPAPTKHLAGGRYALEFALQVVTDKYSDHLPLDRQRRIMAREGLNVETQTLWDQIYALARHYKPTYEAVREYIIGADVIGADETWWRLMAKRSSKKWWVWAITTHNACWYSIKDTRSTAAARKALAGFEGTVICDGYKPYETVAKENSGIRLAHCWAHVRRYFVESEDNYPKACGEALTMIGALFEVERSIPKVRDLDGEEKLEALAIRQKERDAKSRPMLEKLRQWAQKQTGLPKGGLRKAIEYMLSRWVGLTTFLDDPLVEIDNNGTERGLRGLVLGRKNHYGSKSEKGTETAAIFYTLIENAKMCGVNPEAYLRRLAELAIKSPGAVLLPHDFAQ
ncbi:MAG: IS66 family transposase [Planctomycetes bacterium]|nr:IS66 family transposase [Planctomycetota bacterium]